MKHASKKQLLVISSYPPDDATHHQKIVGVASYTKNTLTALSQDTQITVLAETLTGENPSYQKDNITVKRIWKRDSLSLFPSLVKEIIFYYKDTKTILIELEIAMFGGKLSLALLPLFLLLLRLLGKDVTIVMHQVITDIKQLSGHVYTYTGITAALINAGLVLYYKAMLLIASQVITMDEVLKHRLSQYGNSKKITVIPHGVETFPSIPSKAVARRALNIPNKKFVLLYFGFLAWYKGADALVTAFQSIPKKDRQDIQLILAGGPNPNHADKPSYMRYIKNLETVCKKEGITITGFVQENEISTYFQAADVVLFPYRTLMSASGPLSMAFSFEKPFLLSTSLKPLMLTKDIKECLKRSKVPENTLVMDTQKELTKEILSLKNDKKTLEKRALLSKAIKQQRSWKNIGSLYDSNLFGH